MSDRELPGIQPGDEVPEGQKKKKQNGCLYGAIAIVAIPALLGALLLLMPKGDGNPESHAIVACEQAVEAMLKTPSTASFQTGAKQKDDTVWSVAGYVTAENSFGAKIRSEFECNVGVVGDQAAAEVLYVR